LDGDVLISHEISCNYYCVYITSDFWSLANVTLDDVLMDCTNSNICSRVRIEFVTCQTGLSWRVSSNKFEMLLTCPLTRWKFMIYCAYILELWKFQCPWSCMYVDGVLVLQCHSSLLCCNFMCFASIIPLSQQCNQQHFVGAKGLNDGAFNVTSVCCLIRRKI